MSRSWGSSASKNGYGGPPGPRPTPSSAWPIATERPARGLAADQGVRRTNQLSRIACLLLCAPAIAIAGPVEFGLSEYNAALAARGLKWKAKTELSLDPPETFRIEPYRAGGATIFGGDLRGLMYGLLEAAEQIRSTGRLTQAHGIPDTAMRGVRVFLHPADLEKYPESFWRSYFEVLARDRFNRFTLVFTEPMPYPFLFPVEGSAGVRVSGLTADQRERNLRRLRFLSQTANDYAIEFTLGIWENAGPPTLRPAVEGLTRTNTGPYSYNALRKLLAVCPMIRSVQMQSGSERVGFYRDYVFKALHEAGRRVTLDPRGSLRRPSLLRAAEEAGVALRLATAPWSSGFEIDPPLAPGRWEFEGHQLFYWLWGRLSYDPKAKPPKGDSPDEYRAANQVIHLLAAAHQSDPNMYTWPAANPGCLDDYKAVPPRDWGTVASIPEAVHSRLERVASAKQTPLETADLLTAAAEGLEKAARADFRILARLARYHAQKQEAAYHLELFNQTKDTASLDRAEQDLKNALAVWLSLGRMMGEAENGLAELLDVRLGLDLVAQRRKDHDSAPAIEIPQLPKPLPRPQFAHMPVKTALPDQPLTLTLQITSLKDARAVRLHYRSTNPAAPYLSIEKPAAALLTFTIPASDVSVNWDLLYYFEILNHDNGGWFEPDPVTAAPYHVVSITAPPP